MIGPFMASRGGNNDKADLQQSKLRKLLKNIHSEISDLSNEITDLPETVSESVEDVQDTVQENIHAQAEMKILEYVSDVKSLRPQIEAKQDQIELELEELDQQLTYISRRYGKKHQELDQQAAQRIRDLGEHIFRIDEAEFERGIEDPMVQHVTTTWQDLRTHNRSVGSERSRRLRSTYQQTTDSIDEFVDQYEELLEEIQRHQTDIQPSDPEHERFQLPYWVVTVERNGVESRKVVVPSELGVNQGKTTCGVTLDAYPGLEEPLSDLARQDVTTALGPSYDAEELTSEIEPYVDDPVPDLASMVPIGGLRRLLSYESAFERILPSTVAVETQSKQEGS